MKKNAILFLFMTIFVSGCAINAPQDKSYDIFENYNRKIFSFNMSVDKYILKPIAKGYIKITTKSIRKSVTSILTNIWEPFSAVNHILQGDVSGAGVNVSRFVINTTIGIFGAFDVAKDWGLEQDRTGFDETLAHWCVPDGPYIVLPFLGPATPRTVAAMVVNNYANPVIIASNSLDSDGKKTTLKYSYEVTRVVVARANAMPFLDDLEKNSVDFYTAMRSAYLQNRAGTKCFLKDDAETYDFDFGMDE